MIYIILCQREIEVCPKILLTMTIYFLNTSTYLLLWGIIFLYTYIYIFIITTNQKNMGICRSCIYFFATHFISLKMINGLQILFQQHFVSIFFVLKSVRNWQQRSQKTADVMYLGLGIVVFYRKLITEIAKSQRSSRPRQCDGHHTSFQPISTIHILYYKYLHKALNIVYFFPNDY